MVGTVLKYQIIFPELSHGQQEGVVFPPGKLCIPGAVPVHHGDYGGVSAVALLSVEQMAMLLGIGTVVGLHAQGADAHGEVRTGDPKVFFGEALCLGQEIVQRCGVTLHQLCMVADGQRIEGRLVIVI